MKKLALVALMGLGSFSAQAADTQGLGVALNYGLISGPTVELSYPISSTLQVRGALSSGMDMSESTSDSDIDYDVETEGGINRLSLDYHPFEGSFFLSAGYAFNDFKLNADGSKSGTVEVGNDTFTGLVNVNGQMEWESAPMLSLGWGHSPESGWGAMLEVGAIFTGAPDTSLSGTVDGQQDARLDAALRDEEAKLQNDVGDYDFLPVLQAGVTYRF